MITKEFLKNPQSVLNLLYVFSVNLFLDGESLMWIFFVHIGWIHQKFGSDFFCTRSFEFFFLLVNEIWYQCMFETVNTWVLFEITGKVVETSKSSYRPSKVDNMMPPLEPIRRMKPKLTKSRRKKRQTFARTPTFSGPSTTLPKPKPVVQSSTLTPLMQRVQLSTEKAGEKVLQMPPLEKGWSSFWRK